MTSMEEPEGGYHAMTQKYVPPLSRSISVGMQPSSSVDDDADVKDDPISSGEDNEDGSASIIWRKSSVSKSSIGMV